MKTPSGREQRPVAPTEFLNAMLWEKTFHGAPGGRALPPEL